MERIVPRTLMVECSLHSIELRLHPHFRSTRYWKETLHCAPPPWHRPPSLMNAYSGMRTNQGERAACDCPLDRIHGVTSICHSKPRKAGNRETLTKRTCRSE